MALCLSWRATRPSARRKQGARERRQLGYYPHRTCTPLLIYNSDVEFGKPHFSMKICFSALAGMFCWPRLSLAVLAFPGTSCTNQVMRGEIESHSHILEQEQQRKWGPPAPLPKPRLTPPTPPQPQGSESWRTERERERDVFKC